MSYRMHEGKLDLKIISYNFYCCYNLILRSCFRRARLLEKIEFEGERNIRSIVFKE